MKIGVAQIKPVKGDVDRNITLHNEFIDLAISHKVDLIVFPELSLTNYEPELAKDLATTAEDTRFNGLQKWSDTYQISICVGMPVKTDEGTTISMLIFQPLTDSQTYSKQYLHPDEEPYFVNGKDQLFLTIEGLKIAPAICYESLLPKHSANAANKGANIYMASVAKSKDGIDKAHKHFMHIAKEYGMIVVMANNVGYCDNFLAYGNSAVWGNMGKLLAHLDHESEGILIFDTTIQDVIKVEFNKN